MTLAPAAGWYDDPMDDSAWRWWDGSGWTEQSRAKADVSIAPVPAYAPPPAFVIDEPAYVEPEPAPAPVFEVPAYVEPEPVYQAPEPVYQAPEPEPQHPVYDISSPLTPAAFDHVPAYVEGQTVYPGAAASYSYAEPAPQPAPQPVAPSTAVVVAPPQVTHPFAPDPVVSVAITPEPVSTAVALRAPGEPSYPWDDAIEALAAENARYASADAAASTYRAPTTSTASVASPTTTSSALVPTTRRTAAAAPKAPAASASTPWIWLLAFSQFIFAAIAGGVVYAAITLLSLQLTDPTLMLVGLGAVVVGFLPLLAFADRDRKTLAARDLPAPSALWMLLLPPIGYFAVRGRKLKAVGASARGPEIALFAVIMATVVGGALIALSSVSLLTSLGIPLETSGF